MKRTYINIINEFWDNFDGRSLSKSAVAVYFYLLNRINRNRWQPVSISNSELAEGAGVSRRALPRFKDEITRAGLLIVESQGIGCKATTVYTLPAEVAPVQADVPAKCEAVAEPVQAAQAVQTAVYEVAGAAESADAVAETVAALDEGRRRAKAQGEMLMESFFRPSQQSVLEGVCKRCGLATVDELREVSQMIVDDWTHQGRMHNRRNGSFDISEAVKHLLYTLPLRSPSFKKQREKEAAAKGEHPLVVAMNKRLQAAIEADRQARGITAADDDDDDWKMPF